MAPYIQTNIHNHVAHVEFYHPKGNSFPSTQLVELTQTFEELGKNTDVKLIVLKSKGEKIFCSGASFDELLTIDNAEKGTTFFSGFSNVILAMKNCPKFIVAEVEGKVVGGGVGLVCACDYSLATENASIKLSELSIGIGPFVIEPAIRRKIGLNPLSELTLQPTEWKSAEWCQKQGVYNQVFKNKEDLQKATEAFTQNLSKYSADAMRLLKSIFWEGTENWETVMQKRAAVSGELVLSDFTKETLLKFKSKET